MAEQVIDQGRIWWPPGLPAQNSIRVIFNEAQAERPRAMTIEDYETHAPMDAEVSFEQQGTGRWARWTAATLHFKKPEHRGRSFRWTLVK